MNDDEIITMLGHLDNGCREAAIILADEARGAPEHDIRMAMILIGEFRDRLRNLCRSPDGKLPAGWNLEGELTEA